MFTKHLKWRTDNSIDSVLESFDFHERNQYLQAYPLGYYNTDKNGRPVSIQLLGRIDPKRIKQVTTPERMIMYHVQVRTGIVILCIRIRLLLAWFRANN